MESTNKPRSLLAEGADFAGPIVRDPRPFVRAQLRKATPEELIAEILDRAKLNLTFKRQLLTAVDPFRPGPGIAGSLPKSETL